MLLGVESIRVCDRYGHDFGRDARAWLDAVSLLPLDGTVLDCAVSLPPPNLGTLDALHLATAQTIRNEIGAFLTYDHRLAEAATACGFAVLQPSPTR
jgi:predicted nucleic acid-binding protein